MKKIFCLLLALLMTLSVMSFGNAENAVNIPIKKIALDSNNISLLLGSTDEASQARLNLTVTPEDATVNTFTFTTSNENIVTVDETGNLKAIGVGKARITIVPNEEKPRVKAVCNVTVGQAVTKINIPATQTIQKGKSWTIKPEILPKEASNKKVTYTSSNPSIATVSASGAVKGIKCGQATITCTALDGSGISKETRVTIIQPVTRVTTKTKQIVMFKGQSINWPVSVEPADATNRKVNYSSESSWIATIGESGSITAKQAGKTKLTASATDGSNRSCSVNLIVEPSVPISLDSIGFGIFNYNLLGITVTNRCSKMTIVDFDFDLAFYDYGGNKINSGSYSLGSQVKIGPGRTKTIKRTVFGVGQAYKTVIGITGVLFSDGSYWSIPSSEQESWSFTR